MNLTNNLLFILIFFLCLTNCNKKTNKEENETNSSTLKPIDNIKKQDSIVSETLHRAYQNDLYSQEFQSEIDRGLALDSTIANLWQQKAMPLFKQGKYEIGMKYIDNAVKYDRQGYQDYRAFTKCIFAKTYKEAIADFQDYKKRFGYSYVMDHSYDFYIGLSYLQLNEFKKAEEIFKTDYESQINEHGKSWLHPVDLFYYGISKYEQGKYKEAIELFNLALEIHTQFSDVQYYKAFCLDKIGLKEDSKKLMETAKINGERGYSFNEDNADYERYPYQVRWK